MAASSEIRLGQLLIQKRWCTLKQVNIGLAEQKVLREQGVARSLGAVLIDKGFIDEERIRTALSQMGALRLFCQACEIEVPIADYSSGAQYPCPRCQGELRLSESPVRKERGSGLLNGKVGEVQAGEAQAGDEAEDDPVVCKMIGGCQILSRIAKGGMGVVYKAKQLKLGRPVAVKILSEQLAKDRNYVHRFLQEARAAAELNHGNIVHIFDVGEINGLFYIIMEYIDGSNLREILETHHKLEPQRAFELALQASHALRHAHQRGVIHRDIKPENIMITRDGVVKIADLGLAKKVAAGDQDGGITSAGAILGTPYYMAPEQVKDFSKVDGRSDIYSLGVTLFRALTGSVPFKGRTPVEVMIHVVDGKRPTIRSLNPAVPPDVELLVDRMMHRDPAQRFQDLSDVIREMEQVLFRLRLEDGQRVVVGAAAGAEAVRQARAEKVPQV